ncbi:MAG TPA: hypothetical protein VFZ49_03045 [Pyrinomonadaceae bacterium]
MKKYLANLAFVFCLLFVAATSSQAQKFAQDFRPFDFNEKYYYVNGVLTNTLIGRKNGADGESVFDYTNDRRFSNVRITATLPAYDSSGAAIFWNYFSGVPKYGFTEDENGQEAVSLAYAHPLYMFPSTTVKNSDRQAALVRMGEGYFEKNALGIAAVFLVEYTEKVDTDTGQVILKMLAERNGISVDGTPIIRAAKEIDGLLEEGLITLTQPSLDEPYRTPFAVAKVIQYPRAGAITPDAFLKYVKEPSGKPLAAEAHFVSMFECLQAGGKCL